MATVVVLNGRHHGEWYTVTDAPKGLILGRSDHLLAAIVDPRVSREHLRIYRSPETQAYHAQDLDSHNGTRVNGKPTQTQQLKDSDTIIIGHTMLVFTERDFDGQDAVDEFVEQKRQDHKETLEQFEEREQYTEAAAIFSRLFRWRKPRKG